jgi:hypothetical protein
MTGPAACSRISILLALATTVSAQSLRFDTPPDLPNGRVGATYGTPIVARGGTAPYSFDLTGGSLPPGVGYIRLASTLVGVPTQAGQYSFTIRVTDSDNDSEDRTFRLVVLAAQPLAISTGSLPAGTVNQAYNATLDATGGTSPYSWSSSAGTLPPGVQINSNGALSGAPTAAGTFDFTARVVDSASQNATRALQITIAPAAVPPTIVTSSLPSGTAGQAYSASLSASGGTPPYVWSVSAGALPAGVSLAGNGAITGTPTATGDFDFTARVNDNNNLSNTRPLRITIAPAATPPSLTTTSMPNGTVGQAYSGTIVATGGAPPYVFTVSSGSLPPSLTLSPSGVVSGTPTAVGNFDFTALVTDANSLTASRPLRITVAPAPTPPSITTTSLPNGTVSQAYTGAIAATGGTAPYTFSVSSGALPTGLTLNPSSGAISGTPTAAGDFDFTATVTDANSLSGSRPLRITVAPAPTPPSITTTSLPNGTVNQAYSGTIAASGGSTPYTFAISNGALPAGLTLNPSSGAISGTPTATGDFDFTARVTDNNNLSATRGLRITVAAAPTPPSITTTSLPNGRVNQSYSGTIAASGGTSPYTFAISSGALPAGLTLNPNGGISGTPTTAGDFDFTARVTDDNSLTGTRALRITVTPAPTPPSITTSTLPNGTVNQAYSASIVATGGATPYAFTVSAGTLPPGLSLNANGSISGTPTTAGNSDFTVRVTDNNSLTATRQLRITIGSAPTPPSITTSTLANGTVNQAYAASIVASGGATPYAFTVSAGTLPPGLSLNASGSISGTPTTAGDFDFTVRVMDDNDLSATRQLRITIRSATAPLSITTSTFPAGTVGQAYSASIAATGGTPPYRFTAPSGTFAPGLGLNPDGTISGTPTAPGNFDFTARVTDAANQSATRPLRFTINPSAAPLSISNAAMPNATAGAAYTQNLAAAGGRGPYVWSITTGSLPAGLTLNPTGNISGTPSTPGPSSFTLRVTDADAKTAERAFSIAVGPAISVSACPTASGRVATNYSSSATALGGTPPYLWSVTTGQTPPGLTLNSSNGTFSGTPLLAGAFTFTLNVSDAGARTAGRSCTITVAGALQIITETLPDSTIRDGYAQTLQAAGGSPPYRWTSVSGALPPGIVLDGTTGAVSGQATQPGRFTFNVQLNDAGGASAQRSFTIAVAAGLTIPACPTAVGMSGLAYSSTLSILGGQPAYTWAVASGALPQGLNLASGTGVLAGTPTVPGRSDFTIRATDSSGSSIERPCAIDIASELMITTGSMPSTEVGANYTVMIEAVGGTAPRNWTITAGALAPGLTLNSATGQITGTATAPGVYRFTARVSDATGAQRDKQLEIIAGSGFTISACPAPSATLGQPYSSAVSLSGGEAPVVWTLSSGNLPAGINLSAQTGVVTGTATTLETVDFVLGATDARARVTTRACSINVVPAALRILAPDPMSDAILGNSYTAVLQAEGGRGPYTWSMAEGILPPGISLDAAGGLSGTPTAAGSFPLIVRVVDADTGTATRSITVRVVPAPAPNISFTELPDILQPAQQPRVRLTLDAAYPTELRGRLALRFTPDPGLNVDDPSVRFVTGSRTVDFTIPADSTEAVFTAPQFALQTGSVAGVIDLGVTLMAGNLDVTPSTNASKSIRIDRTAPTITSVRLNPIAGGFEVVITGFSTTREVTSATFTFTPATGSRLESSQVTVQTNAAARQWFSDTRSNEFGGQFAFTQPFTLTNATLSDVSVTLTNGQGTSQPASARF